MSRKVLPIAKSKHLNIFHPKRLPSNLYSIFTLKSPRTLDKRPDRGFRDPKRLSEPLPIWFLLHVTDTFRKAYEQNLVNFLLLLDFSKAFDSVAHDLLSNKLSSNFNFHSSAVFLI
jgi:hypothetical protein